MPGSKICIIGIVFCIAGVIINAVYQNWVAMVWSICAASWATTAWLYSKRP